MDRDKYIIKNSYFNLDISNIDSLTLLLEQTILEAQSKSDMVKRMSIMHSSNIFGNNKIARN